MTRGVKDASGNPLSADYAWNFRIASLVGGTCIGDCNGDGNVPVDELIKGVNIALGNTQPSACSQGVPSGTTVDIALLVKAVNAALNGCGG